MKRPFLVCTAALTSLAIGLFGFGGLVYAQTPPAAPQSQPDRGPGRMGPPPKARMIGGPGRAGGGFGLLAFDANGDGKLTRSEFDAAQHARFNSMDANKDGFITPEEKVGYREKTHADAEAARFQVMDADRNGQISKAEFDAAGKARSDDKERARQASERQGPGKRHMRASFAGDRDGPGPGSAGRHHRGPGADGQRADANADGKVNFEEFSSRSAEAFARADLNKDSIVTIAELQTLTRAMR